MESIICTSCFEIYDEPLLLSCGDIVCKKCLNSNTTISTLVNTIGVINGVTSIETHHNQQQINCSNQIICKVCDKKVSSFHLNKEIQLLVESFKIKSCLKHSRKETNLYCGDCKVLVCSSCKSDKVHKSHQVYDYNLIFFNALYYKIEMVMLQKVRQSQIQSQLADQKSASFNNIKSSDSIKKKDTRVRFNHNFFSNCKDIQYLNYLKNKIRELIPKNGLYSKKSFYMKSIEINKNSVISYFNLATTMSETPNEKSLKLYDGTTVTENDLYLKSIQLNPTNAFCYYNIAMGLDNQEELVTLPSGKKMNKIQLFVKAIETDQNYSLAYYNLAKNLKTNTIIMSNSIVMKRKDLFIKYIHFHPNHSFAYNNLGLNIKPNEVIQLLNGQKMNQKDLYRKSIDLNPNYSNPYINLASITTDSTVTLMNGSVLTKIDLYLKAIDCDENSSNAYNNLAAHVDKHQIICLLNGTKMSKKDLYLKSIDCNPQNANGYNNLALFLSNNDDKIQLLNGIKMNKKELYINSISIDPNNNLMAYNNLANCLKTNETVELKNGKIMNKKDLYIRCIGIDGTIPRIYINLAKNVNFIEKITLEDGNKLSKKDIFTKIIDLEPDQWIHYYNLANSLKLNEQVKLINGQKIGKKELYIKAIDLNAYDARLFNGLISILKNNEVIKLLNGLVLSKKDLYCKSMELEPNNSNTYFNLAMILTSSDVIQLRGCTENMNKRDLFIKCISLDPKNSKSYIYLADEMTINDTVVVYNNAEMNDGQLMNKLDLYIKSIDVFAKNAVAYYKTALYLPEPLESVQLLNGRAFTRQQLLLKSISINPRMAHSYFLLGQLLGPNESIKLPDGLHTGKKDLFIKSIELSPYVAQFYFGLATHMASHQNALEMIAKINGYRIKTRDVYLKSLYVHADYLFDITTGQLFLDMANMQTAHGQKINNIEQCTKAIDSDPFDYNNYFQLAYYLGFDESVTLLNNTNMTRNELCIKTIQINPNHVQSYFCLYFSLKNSSDDQYITMLNGEKLNKKDLLSKIEYIDKKFFDIMFHPLYNLINK
ncbi:hypothetical protein DICPUDRAFT_96644 [Dictyostelium purpureum]|uniref:B box-type domain-containing protein n=1 Tax=Dictyostelium purpureum TaxID=5786 RepID=F0ZA65_DICPU|nr:uncharacterized protein DICPUDRAFT_96644 [Dictyostelium purpureum]EGC39146.1 hypothetical protein DICPUDRAFT_96644 [Dictyostelium purpureum]|eukprot:XP_003284292.1 hypothetical protein DICPUDRAFT_96644 [Dictyostelium purpureum]